MDPAPETYNFTPPPRVPKKKEKRKKTIATCNYQLNFYVHTKDKNALANFFINEKQGRAYMRWLGDK